MFVASMVTVPSVFSVVSLLSLSVNASDSGFPALVTTIVVGSIGPSKVAVINVLIGTSSVVLAGVDEVTLGPTAVHAPGRTLSTWAVTSAWEWD